MSTVNSTFPPDNGKEDTEEKEEDRKFDKAMGAIDDDDNMMTSQLCIEALQRILHLI